MIMHNVYFWLKAEVSEEDKKGFEQGLKDLVAGVKEIHGANIGRPAPTPARDVVDHSFAYSLFLQFKSLADHDVYQAHAAHQVFIDKYSKLWRVAVYDNELLA